MKKLIMVKVFYIIYADEKLKKKDCPS